MNKSLFLTIIFLLSICIVQSQNYLKDKKTNEPVSFATISFGNGNGLFADEDGKFVFTKKLYPDIDSIFITSIGYKELKLATENLPKDIFMEASRDELQEVIVQNKPRGKYKIEEIEPTLHDDYFKCWLPTIESEIAVYFPRYKGKPNKIEKVYIPIKIEASNWSKRKKSNAQKRPFSTLFKVNFYENNEGVPGDVLTYDKITFIATEKSKSVIELDVKDNDIYVPKNGMFVSVQILGYTDKLGKLLPNKKYKEVKTKKGIVKVSTTFRPLLPFTDQIKEKKTFVKRIFLNNNQWERYDKQNTYQSKLIKEGLVNYGIGLEMRVYKEE